MKRLFILLIVVLALSCGSCAAAGTAQAKERPVSSRGSIIYRQDGMEAALYAQDLLFLKDKLDTITGEVFAPDRYVQNIVLDNEDERDTVLSYHERGNGQTASEEEQADMEIEEDTENEEDTEILEQEETGGVSAKADSLEGNSTETEDTEDISDSTDPSEGDSLEIEDTEDISDSTDSSEENPSEIEDTENPSEIEDAENTPEIEDTENPSETEDAKTEPDQPVEGSPETGNIKEQVITKS